MTKKQNKLKGLFCKWLLLCLLLLSGTFVNAQMRVGGSTTPDQNAILDLNPDASDNADKGLLLPRVKLVATANPAPLTAHTKGMYVFNTITRNDVKENAVYYNDGTKWQKVVDASSITGELGDTILNYITNNVTQELTDSILAKMNVTSNDQTVDVVRNGSDFDLSVNINNVADSLAQVIINSQLGDSIINLITNNIDNPTYNLGDEILNYITNNLTQTQLGDTILQYITNNFPSELGDTILNYIINNVTQELTDSILAKMNVTSNDQTVDVVRNGSDFDLSVNINNVADSLAQVIINSQLGDSIINLITNNIDNPTYNLGDEILNYITNNLTQTQLGDTILQYITNNFPSELGDTILNYIINNVTQELTDSILAKMNVTSNDQTVDVVRNGSDFDLSVNINNVADSLAQVIINSQLGDSIINLITNNIDNPTYNLGDEILNYITNNLTQTQLGDTILQYITNNFPSELGDTILNYIINNVTQELTDSIFANVEGIRGIIVENGTGKVKIGLPTGSAGQILVYDNKYAQQVQQLTAQRDAAVLVPDYILAGQLQQQINDLNAKIAAGEGDEWVAVAPTTIQTKETVTTLVDNGGTYTYTNENGDAQTIDVVSDIYNYGDTLLSNTTFIENLTTNNQFLDSITNIIKQDETVTNVTGNNGVYTYTNENDDAQTIDVVSDIYNYGDTLLSNTTFIENLITNNQFLDSITNIIKQDETVTTLTDNANGTYTYTSEDGTVTGIDVVSDIYNYGDTLLSNVEFIKNLVINNQFLDSVTKIIKQDETVTTLTDNGDGTYTYTSEDGTATKIDVVSDIYNYGDTIRNYFTKNVTQELTDSIFANVEGVRGITVETGTDKVKIGLPTGSAGQILVYDNKYAQQVQQLIAQRDAAVLVPDYILAGQLQQQINDLNAKIAAGEGDEWVAVAPTTIQTKETVTTLVDNGGTYTYTNENGDAQTIDVVSDIYNYGDTLLSNTTFIENLITNNQFLDSIVNIIKQDETVTNVTGNNGVYTYTNENGDAQTIDVVSDIYNYGDTLLSNTTFIDNLITNNQFLDSITNIIKQDETVTTLTDNANGTYTYTSEDGTVTGIDVVSDIYNYGDTLLSNTTFIENLITNNQFLDSIVNIIKQDETVTNVTGNNGVYTYTNENGDAQTIDVVSDIYNYGDTLLSNTIFIENLITNNQFLDSITNIIKQDETVTNVTGSNGVYTYTNENGDAQTIDVVSDIYNYGDTLLSNTTFIDSINKIVKAEETVTNVAGNNGVYTYTNENGDAQTIDVVSDIYNYGDTLLSNTTFIENLITNNQFLDSITNIIKQDETVTNVTGNNGVYTYTNENGDAQTIDVVSDIYNYGDTLLSNTTFIENLITNNQFLDSIVNIIKQDETVTNVTGNNGVYTYTNENGDTQKIDVVSDIYNYGDTLLSNTTFIENLTTNNQFLDSITNIIKQDEIVTNVTGSNGVYTYTNENGDAQTIDVVSDIYNYGDTLLSNTTFIDSINKIVKAEETVTNVTGNNGVYTYTNENGDAQTIDVVSDIYNYGDTLLSNTTFIDNLITNNQFLDSITNIIKQDETVTNVTGNNGVYTYTNENGDAQTIDVVSDIYNYGDTLLSNTTFIDSINKIVKAEETVTTLTKNGNKYTYTSEDGTTTDIISQKYYAGFGLTATDDTIFNVKPVEIADSIARAINNTILKDTIINLVKDNSVKVKMLEIAMDSIIGTQSKIFFGTTAASTETIEVVGIEPIFTGNRVMRLTKLKVNASAELNAAKTTVDWSVTIDNDNIIAADTCTLHKVVISYICKNDITNNTTGIYNIAGR